MSGQDRIPPNGLLHRLLNVPPDQEIPQERLREATRSGDENTRRLATVAHALHMRAVKAQKGNQGTE